MKNSYVDKVYTEILKATYYGKNKPYTVTSASNKLHNMKNRCKPRGKVFDRVYMLYVSAARRGV